MSRIALDTNVIVAALLSWHEHHKPALKILENALSKPKQLTLASTALTEAYSVMTRLPSPYKVSAKDAYALLQNTFRDHADIVALTGRELWELLETMADKNISGGRTYDVVIAACARKARAKELYTFNTEHFTNCVEDTDLNIIPPNEFRLKLR